MRMINKRGEILHEALIFVVLVVTFLSATYVFAARAGTGANIVEQTHAKQIALIIDQAKKGTFLDIDISELNRKARKNDYFENVVEIDNGNKRVIVKIAHGKGYSFEYFNGENIVWNLKDDKLHLEVGG
jgi:uncharacterized protein (UPF0333 family)